VPTYDALPRFFRDLKSLRSAELTAFYRAVRLLADGVDSRRFDPSLRVKRVQGSPGVWEMTWAPDGRATFHYGEEVRPGKAHIVWRRIGTHSILRTP